MAPLSSSKHELFAQFVAKGINHTTAYTSAGYSKSGANRSAARLLLNADICARIKELKTAVASGVVAAEIRKRSWRVLQLQGLADKMLALVETRQILYGGQLGEGQVRKVVDLADEERALEDGYVTNNDLKQPPRASDSDLYPKNLIHPGYPNGGETGMIVKDYRGKNADQEIWKFDGALVGKLCDTLKQAAIEEGQWTEKRELSGAIGSNVIKERLIAGRQRVADAQKAANAKLANSPK